MSHITHLVIGVFILQVYVNAAPSDVSKPEIIIATEKTEPVLNSEPKVIEEVNTTQTQRQKRWYNNYGYGFPPISPVIYPNYNIRDDNINTANYGFEDPFAQIHRRLQEIANVVRQPIPPPPPPQIPIFYPVIFVPTFNCGCGDTTTRRPTPDPTTEGVPDVTSRWPDMEDVRQNWGPVANTTDEDDDEDYSRPISFTPIKPLTPVRPPPPVEHGSVQGGNMNNTSTVQETTQRTTTVNPTLNQPSLDAANSSGNQRASPPTPCESAILSCCHQQYVAYDCFAIQGCPDFTSYGGSPCERSLILRVIEKFQLFYTGRRDN